MTYQTPQLILVGSAQGLVLGTSPLLRKYRDNAVPLPDYKIGFSRNTELE